MKPTLISFRRVAIALTIVAACAPSAHAQNFDVGSFTKNTTVVSGCTSGCPTNVVTHNLGVTPSAMILWSVGKTNSSFGGSFLWTFGMTDGTASGTRAGGTGSVNAQANSRAFRKSAARIAAFYTGGGSFGTVIAEADFTSWNATSFTITWPTNDANPYIIHYLLIGGSGVSAKVWTYPSASSNTVVTQSGAAFPPELVINMNHGHNMGYSALGGVPSSNILSANAGFGLGVMDPDGNQWATGFMSVDSSGTMDTQRGQQTNATFYNFSGTFASRKTGTCVVPCMTSDGFSINFNIVGSDLGGVMSSLGLQGVNFAVGKFNKNATAASGCSSGCPTNVVSGLAFSPRVVILMSFQDITRASPVAHTRFGFGVSDGTNEGAAALTDLDAAGSSNVWAIDKTTKGFIKVNNNNINNTIAPVIDAEGDVTMNPDGFTVTWTTNDTVGTEILYLALGEFSTAVDLTSFGATRYDRGVLVEWRTGYEVDNLGFHVYREVDGQRTRVTQSLVAGTGLRAGQGTTVAGEQRYAIWDVGSVDRSAAYWLEDVDFTGKSRWHGPVTPVEGGLQAPDVVVSSALRDVGKGTKRRGKTFVSQGARLEHARKPGPRAAGSAQLEAQRTLASQPTVKIGVNRPGWIRVTQPELIAAGLDPHADPRTLRLFVDGLEQAMTVVGEADRRFDSGDVIEFYGTGADTPFTDTRVYWLVADTRPGRRIAVRGPAARGAQTTNAHSFAFTVQQKERSIYFASLVNGDAENWFGSLVYEEPTELTFNVSNVDPLAGADLELTLQGITSLPNADPDHRVSVLVNGAEVGEVQFDGQTQKGQSFAIGPGVVREGANTVTLVARGGEEDYSLVDVVRLRYAHTYRADADLLRFTMEGPGTVTVGGFASGAIRVADISDASAVEELRGAVGSDGAGLSAITVRIPASGVRTLLAFTETTVAAPAFVRANRPSQWHEAGHAADYVAIAHADFSDWVAPLLARHERQGLMTARVDVEDLYDEFSFGEKTPQALKDFVRHARASWKRSPRFLLLVGDATFDPRDYAGFGDGDFVPTAQVPLTHFSFETASDDWFADMDDDGLPELAVGRLSVRTGPQAERMIAKILEYETSAGAWTRDLLIVADQNDRAGDFERSGAALRGLVPSGYRVREVLRGVLGPDASRAELLDAVNQGQLIVNYIGHGSLRVWGKDGRLLTSADVRDTWRNGARLPLVVAMSCLNGFFYDIYDEESLAETFLRAPEGGAVAAWASSGITDSSAQMRANEELLRLLFGQPRLTVGEAVAEAKRAAPDRDVRRSWIFFGDPAMRLLALAESSQTPATTAPAQPPATARAQADADGDTGGDEPSAAERAAEPVRLADFNADGRDDVLLYDAETGRWSLVLNERGSQRATEGIWLTRAQVFPGRLDTDRFVDVFLYRSATGEWLQALNNGDGTFRMSSGVWTAGGQVVVSNFAGDPRDEVFLYQPLTGDWFESATDGKGGFSSRTGRTRAGGELSAADFNRDSLADLFISDRASGSGWVVVNDGSGGFSAGIEQWLSDWPARATSLAGKAVDLVLYDSRSGMWGERLAKANQSSVRSGARPAGLAIGAADFNGDGADDLLLYESRTGAWSVLINTSQGLVESQSGVWQPGLRIAAGDLDGDGLADVVLYDAIAGGGYRCVAGEPGAFDCAASVWPVGGVLIGQRR